MQQEGSSSNYPTCSESNDQYGRSMYSAHSFQVDFRRHPTMRNIVADPIRNSHRLQGYTGQTSLGNSEVHISYAPMMAGGTVNGLPSTSALAATYNEQVLMPPNSALYYWQHPESFQDTISGTSFERDTHFHQDQAPLSPTSAPITESTFPVPTMINDAFSEPPNVAVSGQVIQRSHSDLRPVQCHKSVKTVIRYM
ncbi:hypothetical protein M422DRAFT_46172 [Sphaerobolus stellatus SS14]|nr:hypothetical protein M422DRAFT_46172 [Sphaerobolus stellatus SS14]